jgi:hypothetical protein
MRQIFHPLAVCDAVQIINGQVVLIELKSQKDKLTKTQSLAQSMTENYRAIRFDYEGNLSKQL